MLRIEIDMFSGRPNPVWIITDPGVTKQFLDAVAGAEGMTAKQGSGFTGLGFREVRVDLMGDDEPRRRRVARQFALASTAVADLQSSGALARRLIEDMPLRSEVQLLQHAITPLTRELRAHHHQRCQVPQV